VDEIYCDLVEDACLGLSFEVHRAVKQGHFFLDDTDQESMKEFGGYQSFSFFISHATQDEKYAHSTVEIFSCG
jgi:hypothetical protein